MCSYEPGDHEPTTLWKESWHASRRFRRCYSCQAIIAVGERYLHVFYVMHGDGANTHTLCEFCGEAMQAFAAEHGGWHCDVVELLTECSDDGEHAPEDDPWRFRLWLIGLNARRSKWAYGSALAQAWGVQ